MPGVLLHSPEDILRRVLIALGLGADPPATPWPVYATKEPATPDNCITCFGTLGRDDGRDSPTGERAEHHGVQVRVRAATHDLGYVKIRAIAVALDTVLLREIAIQGSTYRVYTISRTTDVIPLGEEPTSSRRIFTINALMSVIRI